jgi:hypothetical protein
MMMSLRELDLIHVKRAGRCIKQKRCVICAAPLCILFIVKSHVLVRESIC